MPFLKYIQRKNFHPRVYKKEIEILCFRGNLITIFHLEVILKFAGKTKVKFFVRKDVYRDRVQNRKI